MRIIFASFFLMVLALPFETPAQSAEPDAARQSDKTLVSVPVAVSDREGHYIAGLKKEDFTIYQDGVKQKITFFATYDEPLNVALLLDTSGSTAGSLKEIKDAAGDFVELLNLNDRCLLATFDAEVKILNPFTADRSALVKSIDRIQTAARDGTVVYRAVEQTVQKSFGNVQGRKVIVLLSDGKDFGSAVTKIDLLSQLEESDVLIYTIFYKTGAGFDKLAIDADGTIKEGKESKETKKPKVKKKKKKDYTIFIPRPAGVPSEEDIKLLEKNADLEAIDALRELSDATAGRFYLSDTPKLKDVFKKVAAELRQQYRLGYRSKDAANNAEAVNISVKVERENVVVRARGKFRAKQL